MQEYNFCDTKGKSVKCKTVKLTRNKLRMQGRLLKVVTGSVWRQEKSFLLVLVLEDSLHDGVHKSFEEYRSLLLTIARYLSVELLSIHIKSSKRYSLILQKVETCE